VAAILDDGVAAGEPLFLQTLPDPLGRVTLLLVNQLVGFQDLCDSIAIRVNLGLRRSLTSLIARRAGVRENLLERLPMHPRLPQDLPFAHPFPQYPAANLQPLVHIHVHFLPFPLKIRRSSQHPQP
jgi:hypothetical protein